MAKINEKKENKIIIKNSLFSIGFKGAEYLLSFFTAPLMLSCLGVSKYGVFTSALSIVSWIYYFDFGIGSGLRNKVTESLVNKDYETAKKSTTVAYIIVSIISIIAFLGVLIFSFFFDMDKLLNAQLNDENLNFILVIAFMLACVNFVLSLATNLLYAIQQTALVSGLGIVSKVLMVLALIIFKKFGITAMLYVVVLEGSVQLVKNILATILVMKKNNNLVPNFKKIDFKYSNGILGFGIQIFVMQISALVLNATDNIIIMKLFSSADVTPYSMCHKYFNIINAFFVAATGPLWTAYTTAYALNDVDYIKKTLKKALKFYLLTFIGIIVSIFVFKPFMKIYLQRELEFQPGLIMCVALYYALLIFSHNFSAFVHGISKVKLTTIACIISAVANIPVSILLAKTFNMGLNGVMLGSVFGLIITTTAYIYTTIKEIKKMEVQ